MGKAFGKQAKTTEDQGKKQIDILKTLMQKGLEAIENKSDDNEKQLKYKEIFNELYNERIGEIYNVSKEINFNNLAYHFKDSNTAPINFIDFNGPTHIYDEIKNGNISTSKIEEDQKQFKSKINEITTGNLKHKSKDRLETTKKY